MNAALIVATLLRLVGPDLDEVHAELVADLPRVPACDRPLLHQPYDCPARVRWSLAAIADRETGRYSAHVRWFGIHRGDAVHELGLWRKGHRRGRAGKRVAALSSWCPAHWDSEGMSTVGPHGQMYALNIHRLDAPGNCVPWWMFASSSFSGEAALDRYLQYCDEPSSSGWCPRPSAVRRALRRRCERNDFSGPACREVTG